MCTVSVVKTDFLVTVHLLRRIGLRIRVTAKSRPPYIIGNLI